MPSLRSLPSLCAALCLAGCDYTGAVWRPAAGAHEYPPEPVAYRVHEADEDCAYLGTVHSEKTQHVRDIAETAAEHGGNRYVIEDVRDRRHVETRGSAVSLGHGVVVASSRSDVVLERRSWATVYRCPD